MTWTVLWTVLLFSKETNSSSELNLFWFTKQYAVCESVYMCEIACFRAQNNEKCVQALTKSNKPPCGEALRRENTE